MNKLFLVLIVLLIGLVTPLQNINTEYQPQIEDGVYFGNGIPEWGRICTDTGVYGDPYGLAEPKYYLHIGALVRLGEMSHGVIPVWIEIGPTQWIPLSAVCDW